MPTVSRCCSNCWQAERFNSGPVNEWVSVAPELAAVVDSARVLSEQSDGAFDVTVGPLVNAWGFGPQHGTGDQQLSASQLAALLENVGYKLLEVTTTPPALRKTAEIYVDLSAIAKGHGVDRLAAVLQRSGCANYLVDIGGEVRVQGVNSRGQLWRIGIEVPDPEAQGGVQRVLQLDNQAVATSGDYRNFRQIDGRRISHTIDP